MRCSQCGHDNQPNIAFCALCGVKLLPQTTQPTNPFAERSPFAEQNQYSEQNPYLASVVAPPPQDSTDSAALRMLIPVGRSPYAIIAGYLGLLSLAACFLGPPAVIFGVLAIRDIRRDSRKHGLVRASVGIVLGLVGSLVLVLFVIGLLVR